MERLRFGDGTRTMHSERTPLHADTTPMPRWD
jgi:hypothetical protein